MLSEHRLNGLIKRLRIFTTLRQLGLNRFRIEFLDETRQETLQVIHLYQHLLNEELPSEEIWSNLKTLGFSLTRGSLKKTKLAPKFPSLPCCLGGSKKSRLLHGWHEDCYTPSVMSAKVQQSCCGESAHADASALVLVPSRIFARTRFHLFSCLLSSFGRPIYRPLYNLKMYVWLQKQAMNP